MGGPSPAVKHHFRELKEKIERLLGHHHEEKQEFVGVEKKGVVNEGFPRIFEDEGETRTMEVSMRIFSLCLCW